MDFTYFSSTRFAAEYNGGSIFSQFALGVNAVGYFSLYTAQNAEELFPIRVSQLVGQTSGIGSVQLAEGPTLTSSEKKK